MKIDKIILHTENLGDLEFANHFNSDADAYDAMLLFIGNNYDKFGDARESYTLIETDEDGEQYITKFEGMNASAHLSASINDTEIHTPYNNR